MSVYTVHEPPQRYADAPDAERFVFVRDGFSFWAFLFGPLWMLRHRMWLVLIGYVVISIAIQILVRASGAAAATGSFIALLVGLEAGTLRRFTLSRRGWKNIGVVSGDDLEDAERRFFDAWIGRAVAQPAPPAAVATPIAPANPMPRAPRAPDVVGLFPEPGARR
jgi:hypothetical protein